MMSPADLPSCTSNTAANAEQFTTVVRTQRAVAARIARRIVVKGLLGLTLPAALFTTSLPAAQPALGLTAAPAAAFAVASTTAGFVGDAPLSATALDEIAAANILSGSLDFGAPILAPTKATTNNNAVNMRTGPSKKYRVVAKLVRGATVDIIGSDGSWSKVSTVSGKTGWILSSLLRVNGTATAPVATTASRSATTVASSVNLRKGPGTSYGSFGKLASGSALTLVARSGDWIQVRSPRGTLGWVRSDLLKASSQALASLPVAANAPLAAKAAISTAPVATQQVAAPASGRASAAVRVAMAQVGRRYVWGGASPRGFDCSGLVQYAYRAAGLSLPHSSKAQFSTRYGTRINSMGALRPGDIVFFANTAGRGISHVALYVGNGRMVTANSPRTGVQLNNINTRYWRSHWAGAIRP
jgi:cell wall-associated NlpC family hydrolase